MAKSSTMTVRNIFNLEDFSLVSREGFSEDSSENKAVSGALAYKAPPKAPRVGFQLACSLRDTQNLAVALTAEFIYILLFFLGTEQHNGLQVQKSKLVALKKFRREYYCSVHD